MSFSKPKRPKYKALPKAPKMKASIEVWKRYEQRLSEVMKENLKRKAAYEAALRTYESQIKQRESIKAKARAAKSKLAA